MPNLFACLVSFCSPSSPASSANAVLHDRASASSMLAVLPLPQFVSLKFGSWVFVFGSVMVGAAVSWVSLVLPSSSAAAATTTFQVEPGG